MFLLLVALSKTYRGTRMAFSPSDENHPRTGILQGPSPGLRAWADWIIDVRKRWHEDDPKRGWRVLLGSGWLLALAAIIEKAVSG